MNRLLLLIFFFAQSSFFSPATRAAEKATFERLLDQAKIFYEKEDYTQAIQILENLVKQNPFHEDALLLLGKALFQNKYYKKSKQIFLQMQDAFSKNPEVFLYLGLLQMQEGAAISDKTFTADYFFRKAEELGYNHPDVLLEVARYKQEIGAVKEAAALYDRLLTDFQGQYKNKALFDLAKINLKNNRLEDALNYLEQAEEITPENSDIYVGLSDYYFKTKNKKKTLEYLNYAYELSPNNVTILQKLALRNFLYRNYADALNYYKILDKKYVRQWSESLFFFMSLTYEALGSYEEAIESVQKGLQNFPTSEKLALKLESLLIHQTPLDDPRRKQISDQFIEKQKHLLGQSSRNTLLSEYFLKKAGYIYPVSIVSRKMLYPLYKKLGWTQAQMSVLREILVIQPNSEKEARLLKSLEYNQKKNWETEQNIPSVWTTNHLPKVLIGQVYISPDSPYRYLSAAIREEILHFLSLSRTIEPVLSADSSGNISPEEANDFHFVIHHEITWVKNHFHLVLRKMHIESGNITQTLEADVYQTDAIRETLWKLLSEMVLSFAPVGQVIETSPIQDILINLGSVQGVKKSTSFQVFLPEKRKNGLDISWQELENIPGSFLIGSASVKTLGEYASWIEFTPLKNRTFPMSDLKSAIFIPQDKIKAKEGEAP